MDFSIKPPHPVRRRLAALLLIALVLPLCGAREPAARTTIESDTLRMKSSKERNLFIFDQNVVVTSTNLEVRCDTLEVDAKRGKDRQKTRNRGTDGPDLGEFNDIEKTLAKGNVRIKQGDRVATAGRAELYPIEGRMELHENPRVEDARAVVEGWKIVLLNGKKKVRVLNDPTGTERVTVTLSALPDLGFDGSASGNANAAASSTGLPASGSGTQTTNAPTVITSDTLELNSTDLHNNFQFDRDVKIVGNNLTVFCDRMEIVTLRDDGKDDPLSITPKADESNIGSLADIQKITAIGNVVILQDGREARAGLAEVFPAAGQLVLSLNPVVVDQRARVSGWKIILNKGQENAVVLNDPDGKQRSSVELNDFSDFGFGEKK